MSPHICDQLADFIGKSQDNQTVCTLLPIPTSMQLRMLFADHTQHQSNHFTTVLQTSEFTQVSPFLSTSVY